jgi:hypothetical protein
VIGRLKRVDLRVVWRHEAWDFTTWLEENIDLLEEELGLTFTTVDREQAAGTFSVDLLAEDDEGNMVVIENQLEKSDHDHLGKLITYLAAFNAQTAIWIVSEAKPEPTAAVAWLNQSTPASFYLVKMEAVQIADSPPAPLLTLIVGTSPESRTLAETKHDLKEQHRYMQDFWSGLIEVASHRTSLHDNISPGKGNWLSASSGVRGVFFNYIVRVDDARVELYIDTTDYDENRVIFDQLCAFREAIESDLGRPLTWDKREGRQVCKIEIPVSCKGYRNRDDWPETYEAMVGAMVRLEQEFRPYLNRLGGETLHSDV